MNVFRLQDDILTDTIFSDTPAIDGGYTQAQVFLGVHLTLYMLSPYQQPKISSVPSRISSENGEHLFAF